MSETKSEWKKRKKKERELSDIAPKTPSQPQYPLVVLLQPGGAVGQQAGVLGGQQVEQALVVGLGVELEQRRVHVLAAAVGHLRAPRLPQVADEEELAAPHLLLVALRQVVEVGELVERRVAARERRRGGQQQRVEGDELPHVQLPLPVKGGRRIRKDWGLTVRWKS